MFLSETGLDESKQTNVRRKKALKTLIMDLTIVPDEALGTVTGVSNMGDLKIDTPTRRIESGYQSLKSSWDQVRTPVRFPV